MISLGRALLASIATLVLGGGAAQASTTCTWAGNPATPTGVMTITPGLTNIPSPRDVRFHAWGQLSGGPRCRGQLQFISAITAGSTCTLAHFEGRVVGLPDVARFVGDGSLDVPSRLYDTHGKLVGLENAEIVTATNLERSTDCQSPSGFRGGWPGMFSST